MENRVDEKDASDLRQIRGIGPGVAHRLAEAGINDVSALAAATPESIAAALQGLPVVSQERIREWIAAAATLAPPPKKMSPENGQHYATFRLELLLDRNHQVRRTRVSHVQSEKKEIWAGWDVARLSDFVRENAGISSPAVMEDAEIPPPQSQPLSAADDLQLRGLTVAAAGSREPSHFVRRGRPYDVHFGVVAGEGEGMGPAAGEATTALYARPLDGEGRYQLGEASATGPAMEVAISIIPGAELSPGAYRLEVEIDQEGQSRRRLTAPLSEGMLLVY